MKKNQVLRCADVRRTQMMTVSMMRLDLEEQCIVHMQVCSGDNVIMDKKHFCTAMSSQEKAQIVQPCPFLPSGTLYYILYILSKSDHLWFSLYGLMT